MSLLFDQNLSRQLPKRLADLFPNSRQTFNVGIAREPDEVVWQYAIEHGLTIVTYDRGFITRSLQHGGPPKVIHLSIGNQRRAEVEALLRARTDEIERFLKDASSWLMQLSR